MSISPRFSLFRISSCCFVIVGLGGVRRLLVVRNGGEKVQRADSQVHQALGLLHQSLHAPARAAGQGGNGLVAVPLVDENRANKMFRGKGGLPDQ